jgi:hypothetical protein
MVSIHSKADHAPLSGPSDMTSFSYFPPMAKVAIDENGEIEIQEMSVSLSTNLAEWSESDITEQFAIFIADNESGWKNADGACDASDLYNLLADYADDDFEPHDAFSVNIEPTCEPE